MLLSEIRALRDLALFGISRSSAFRALRHFAPFHDVAPFPLSAFQRN